MQEISHYFNADFFSANGYLDAVTLTHSNISFDTSRYISAIKSISQTSVSFFNFMWLDTSALSVINLGNEFETYAVEETKSVGFMNKGPGIKITYNQSRV